MYFYFFHKRRHSRKRKKHFFSGKVNDPFYQNIKNGSCFNTEICFLQACEKGFFSLPGKVQRSFIHSNITAGKINISDKIENVFFVHALNFLKIFTKTNQEKIKYDTFGITIHFTILV